MYRFFVFSITMLLCAIIRVSAQNTYNIIVLDSETRNPIETAFVSIIGSNVSGTLTDAKGQAKIFSRSHQNDSVEVRMMGYDSARVPLNRNQKTTVYLNPTGLKLNEITVKKTKEHYSKRNNRAVQLIARIAEEGKKQNPEQNEIFRCDKYELITLALNNFQYTDTSSRQSTLAAIREFVDTTTIGSTPILNVSIRENIKTQIYSRADNSYQDIVIASRHEGIDEFMDKQSMDTYLNDMLREIDIYKGDIVLLGNRFVGPLASIGPDFYKYYITDSIGTDREQIIELSFVPRTSSTLGFTGKFYIANGDSTFLIKEARMNFANNINVNFIDHIDLVQKYHLDSLGNRIKDIDNIEMQMSLIKGTQGLYIKRNTTYSNYNFQSVIVPECQESETDTCKDSEYWDSNRPVSLTHGESNVAAMMERMRKNSFLYWSEQVLRALINGYVPTSKTDSKFDFGPVNTLISTNDVEGVRFRVGGMTTAALSKRLFGRGYIAYGTKDHKVKYYGECEYSFRDKKMHAKEFPIHSISISYLYDVDMIGQRYLFTNADNVFLSLKRMKNDLMTYHRVAKITYIHETRKNLTLTAAVKHEKQEATEYLPFKSLDNKSYKSYTESTVDLSLRFAPGEKFYQTRSHRIPINLDATVLEIHHTFGPKKIFGNTFCINRTELSAQKRFWLSAFGHIDATVKGGHIWSKTPYPSLFTPNANLSYTIQPESFALMNPMEFISDSYSSAFVTYWADGAIFNYIPYLKKLKLREVFSCRGYYGHLSNRNIPSKDNRLFEFPQLALNTPMHRTPYLEASVGIDNLLKCLRIDYVWRLTYRNIPGTDRDGFRIAFHASF